ncbi:hypothetical protein GIB67_002547 [Kingdonia uniflora]|uniref:Agenet domain-containing protein n=1 Tax=Kingdonia uniflora TaxID=39325 RepID=A0A7J7N944_9MAGN|nr:hypothetical protein GIB67_002547 [Kingdonia uniflora]
MAETLFAEGQQVEVTSQEEGFRGSWYLANVVRVSPRTNQIFVEYHSLLNAKKIPKKLIESVLLTQIRPPPPPFPDRFFKVNEEVDVFHADGWWKGVVSKVFEKSRRYGVHFVEEDKELEYRHSELRVHQDWVDGKWVVPYQDDDQVISGLPHSKNKVLVNTLLCINGKPNPSSPIQFTSLPRNSCKKLESELKIKKAVLPSYSVCLHKNIGLPSYKKKVDSSHLLQFLKKEEATKTPLSLVPPRTVSIGNDFATEGTGAVLHSKLFRFDDQPLRTPVMASLKSKGGHKKIIDMSKVIGKILGEKREKLEEDIAEMGKKLKSLVQESETSCFGVA